MVYRREYPKKIKPKNPNEGLGGRSPKVDLPKQKAKASYAERRTAMGEVLEKYRKEYPAKRSPKVDLPQGAERSPKGDLPKAATPAPKPRVKPAREAPKPVAKAFKKAPASEKMAYTAPSTQKRGNVFSGKNDPMGPRKDASGKNASYGFASVKDLLRGKRAK